MSLNKQKIHAIVRSYDDGVTLPALSQLFKVSKHDIINLVHTIKVVRNLDKSKG